MLKIAGTVALSASLALGFAASADAGSTKRTHHVSSSHHSRYVTDQSGIGRFVLFRGDSKAAVERSYPNVDANPPSLRQTYNLRTRTMNEDHK
jgi:hypothetical protein